MPKGLACDHPVAFFPGSSIGDFTPQKTESFLHSLHSLLPVDSGLLIGVDLIKDTKTLNAAYNDVAGVTAALNLNLLERPCREVEADLDPQFIFASGVLQRSAIAYRDALGQRYCPGDRGGWRNFPFRDGRDATY